MAQLPPTPLEEKYKDNGSLQHSCQNRLQSGVLHPKKNTHSTRILMVSFLWWAILTYFHQILKLENFLPQGEIYHRFFHFDTRCGPTSSKDLRSFLRWSSLTRQKKYGPRLEEAVRLERVLTYLNKNGVDATNCGAIYVPTIKKISGHAAVSTCTARLLFYCSFRFHFTTS